MQAQSSKSVVIIGAGPSGLIVAERLAQAGYAVSVYDAMPSVARKLLLAGKGGLNITHSEPMDVFLTRYPTLHPYLKDAITEFSPQEIRAWLEGLGITTFVGSSGRIFPLEMKSAPFVRAWLRRLRQLGVQFYASHQWVAWEHPQQLTFKHQEQIKNVYSELTVLALGGASWPRLGSTGQWQALLQQQGINLNPLQPSNVGFERDWSDYFKNKYAGTAIQSVRAYLTQGFNDGYVNGEITVSEYGLEGGLIYALSANLREQLEAHQRATFYLDLLPALSLEQVIKKLSVPQGNKSWSNYLRSVLKLSPVKISLLNEVTSTDIRLLPIEELAARLKSLPISFERMRPIDEAISSAGGVMFDELTAGFMLRKLPGVFCAGEMLDWDAPTGGYLLTACLASGHKVAASIVDNIHKK